MIGVIADDTTGANDIGIMFRKNGYAVKILTFEEDMVPENNCDVLIIDTDSRLDPLELSRFKVYKSAEILKKAGCEIFHKKTCSVFRGNIGVELDAMMDALKKDFAIISLAFPKNGRTTVHGIHRVNGELLENSNFAKDPVHPMTSSDLVSILSEETNKKVCSIDIEVVRMGAEKLREAIEKVRKNCNYCIIDSETQEDLKIVAEASVGYECLGGSSAIGEELPKFLENKKSQNPVYKLDCDDNNGVLVVSGSLTPQTRAQTAHLKEIGVPTLVVDSRKVFSEDLYEKEKIKIVAKGTALLKEGNDILIMADNDNVIIAETKKRGKALNIDELKISKMVSALLADIAETITKNINLKRLVVAGGDTSGTICRKLGIKGNYVLKEIETGLPSGLAIGREMLIVLKSGSFGKKEFLETSINHLKSL